MPTTKNFWEKKNVLVTGALGFVGRNLVPLLREQGCTLLAPSSREYNLLEQEQIRRLLTDTAPDIVFHLAGLVGGILANRNYPADFCYQNLLMNTMMMHESWRAGTKKYITLIGGCSYPANAPSPIGEEELWNGYPQEESAPYSVAKKMNVVLAESYRRQHGFKAIVLVPGNVYGPFDNFDLNNSHVIPALIRKFYEAKEQGRDEVVAWGTGKPVRDFIYVEDACRAIVTAAASYDESGIINISSGEPTTIRELTEVVAELVGYRGKIVWDASKPDGQLYKGFQVERMKRLLNFQPPTSLRVGIAKTIDWFIKNPKSVRKDVPVTAASPRDRDATAR